MDSQAPASISARAFHATRTRQCTGSAVCIARIAVLVHTTKSLELARDDVLVEDSPSGGKSKVLITTNVLARGVNVDNVDVVINYDPRK